MSTPYRYGNLLIGNARDTFSLNDPPIITRLPPVEACGFECRSFCSPPRRSTSDLSSIDPFLFFGVPMRYSLCIFNGFSSVQCTLHELGKGWIWIPEDRRLQSITRPFILHAVPVPERLQYD